jgi:K+-transporting ATPase ATPase A chain
MTRATLWCCCRSASSVRWRSFPQGVVQNLKPYDRVQLVDPQGDVKSRHCAGTSGIRNSSGMGHEWRRLPTPTARTHENLTPFSNFIEMFAICDLVGPHLHAGTMTRSSRHGWAVWAAMVFLFLAGVTTAYWAEASGNPCSPARIKPPALCPGGNMEGKEALRDWRLGAVRDDHDRRQLRRGQQHARFVHAARRPRASR